MQWATVIGSAELGLAVGKLEDVDKTIASFDREELILRIVNVLNILGLGTPQDVRALSESYREILPSDLRKRLQTAMDAPGAIFLEPWQQLLLLKRTLVICGANPSGSKFTSDVGEMAFFDACRFAADALVKDAFEDNDNVKDDPDAWLKFAAGVMPRLGLLNPPKLGNAIGRFKIMFEIVPSEDDSVAKRIEALDERFPGAMNGLTFTTTTTLVNFLAAWSLRLKPADMFKDPSAIRLYPGTFLEKTTFPAGTLDKFLARTSLKVSDGLKDDGSSLSPVVLRDRPLLQFSDGSVAPIFPPFLLEKLTSDIFWWLKSLDENQQRTWQEDWGYIAEAYVIRILERCATLAGCSFLPRLESAEGEVDSVLWMKGHVAVFEVTSSSLRDFEAASGDWEDLKQGLIRAFVENPKGKKGAPYKEAVLQLVRDVRLILNGTVAKHVPVQNLQRVYPVMVSTDRRARTPGVIRFLQDQFVGRLAEDERARVAGLAVLGLEDLETLESLVESRPELLKTPRGPLKVLRKWDLDRGEAPSWWQFIEVTYGPVLGRKELQSAFEDFKKSLRGFFVSSD